VRIAREGEGFLRGVGPPSLVRVLGSPWRGSGQPSLRSRGQLPGLGQLAPIPRTEGEPGGQGWHQRNVGPPGRRERGKGPTARTWRGQGKRSVSATEWPWRFGTYSAPKASDRGPLLKIGPNRSRTKGFSEGGGRGRSLPVALGPETQLSSTPRGDPFSTAQSPLEKYPSAHRTVNDRAHEEPPFLRRGVEAGARSGGDRPSGRREQGSS